MRSATWVKRSPRSFAGMVTWLCLWPLRLPLQTGDPHSTVDRLFVSQHVKDLRLIAGFALLTFYATTLLLFFDAWSQPTTKEAWRSAHKAITFFGPVLVIVVGVLSWVYQVGSARLGVVDLFACEISTLCRVAAVNDTVRRQVLQFRQGPGKTPIGAAAHDAPARPFTSQESYFPVFESNARDLQSLEAKVVVNITAFYTYMKAVRDALRALAVVKPVRADLKSPSDEAPAGSWREASRNVIYMLFLALESARLAIGQLVEYEPEEAERTIVILISELEAYRFLCSQYTDAHDVHYARIRQRQDDYRQQAPKAYHDVKVGEHSAQARQWRPAVPLLPELEQRYRDATGSAIADGPPSGT